MNDRRQQVFQKSHVLSEQVEYVFVGEKILAKHVETVRETQGKSYEGLRALSWCLSGLRAEDDGDAFVVKELDVIEFIKFTAIRGPTLAYKAVSLCILSRIALHTDQFPFADREFCEMILSLGEDPGETGESAVDCQCFSLNLLAHMVSVSEGLRSLLWSPIWEMLSRIIHRDFSQMTVYHVWHLIYEEILARGEPFEAGRLIPFAMFFLSGAELTTVMRKEVLIGLSSCIGMDVGAAKWFVGGDYLPLVLRLAMTDACAPCVRAAAIQCIRLLVSSDSRKVRERVMGCIDWNEWNETARSVDEKVVIAFIDATWEAIRSNITHIDTVTNTGILETLVTLQHEKSFRVRKVISSMLVQIIKKLDATRIESLIDHGLIESLTDFMDTTDAEQSISVLKALTFLLEVGMSVSFILRTYNRILALPIYSNVQLLLESENPQLRNRARRFYDTFLNTEQYISDP